MEKNVASQTWTVFAFDRTDNTPKTGDAANITAKIGIDGTAVTGTNDTNPTEIEDGYYEFTLTQAETNGTKLFLTPESSTGDVQVIACPAVIYTTPPYFNTLGIESDGDLTKANLVATVTTNTDMRGTDLANTTTPPTAAAIRAEMDSNSTQLAAIVADTNELQTDDVPALIAALDTVVDRVEADTQDLQTQIGTAGVGLTNLGGMSTTMKGQVNTEVDTAISDAALATAANLATVDSVVDAIKAVTDLLPNSGALTDLATAAAITALNDLSAADVNAQVLDVLNTDTFAEPGQESPAATASLVTKIGYLYKYIRNRKTETATTFSLYNDDATTVDQKATIADDGTTASKTELTTGP